MSTVTMYEWNKYQEQKQNGYDGTISDFLEIIKNPPIGTLFPYHPNPKENYLPCDGRTVLVSEYRELYECMKDTYGKNLLIKEAYEVGEKIAFRDTFRIPDMRDSQGVICWIKAR